MRVVFKLFSNNIMFKRSYRLRQSPVAYRWLKPWRHDFGSKGHSNGWLGEFNIGTCVVRARAKLSGRPSPVGLKFLSQQEAFYAAVRRLRGIGVAAVIGGVSSYAIYQLSHYDCWYSQV